MWLYFPAKNLSHSEGSWLCDYTSSQKSIPFWGDLTMWLYPKEWNQYHSAGTWLCDYISSPKSIPLWDEVTVWLYPKEWNLTNPFWGDLTMWLYFPAKNLSHSEGTWLCDYISSPKSIPLWDEVTVWLYPKEWNLTNPFWGDLTMWIYLPAKKFFHFEGTWLCDCVLSNEIFDILRGPDYVIILSS